MGGSDQATIEAIRAKAVTEHHGLVMVGPLASSALVRLLFGSERCADAGSTLTVTVVPRSAWSTVPPGSSPPRLTVGFHGSGPALAALTWAIGEAEQRDGVVHAVMAWCEGQYGGQGGPVRMVTDPPSAVARSARQLAADSLSTSGVRADRVSTSPRRGLPARILIGEAAGSDLLALGAGQCTVSGHRTLGAITSACLTRSSVPVVVVPSGRVG